jgi:hypothetical protein
MMAPETAQIPMLVLWTLMVMAVLAILVTQAGAVDMMMMTSIPWLCAVRVVVVQMMV